MASFKNMPVYLWDFAFQFADLLDFIEFSERNLEWQRRSYVQSLDRRARLKNYEFDEYSSELRDIEYRFDVLLSRLIRYAAVIALATLIEWIAKFLEERSTCNLPQKPNRVNKSIHVIRTLFELSDCRLEHNLEALEKVIKLRHCIAHAAGSVENYKYASEIVAIVGTLEGFGISDRHYINGMLGVCAVETIVLRGQV